MATERRPRLLGPDDPAPVVCSNAFGRAPFLLTGDHAGSAIPASLGTLGLEDVDLARHIACDIGVAGLGEVMSDRLGATFLRQAYSRLVIDCNRDPDSEEAMAPLSDGTVVPGNVGLSEYERSVRVAEIHEAYHSRIASEIAARLSHGQPSILIALHSFTPSLAGVARPWDVGVLHEGGNEAFARRLLEALGRETGLTVGDNEPYHLDETDYSVPCHAFPQRLPYAEIEVRQDHIVDPAGQRHWAEILIIALTEALRLSD